MTNLTYQRGAKVIFIFILEHKTVSACMLLPAVEWIIWYSISSKSPFGRAEGSLCEAGTGATEPVFVAPPCTAKKRL